MISPTFLQAVRKLTCLLAASSLFLSIAACGGGGGRHSSPYRLYPSHRLRLSSSARRASGFFPRARHT